MAAMRAALEDESPEEWLSDSGYNAMLIGLLLRSTRVSRVYQPGRRSCSCDFYQGLPSLGSPETTYGEGVQAL
jgi:hypothetical protein